ncbi:hypothetical protein [Neorhizobium sp. T6_25]|uniref:hypothetical protein n=1 Tax=Neorhizobium sp. T6_25 TaxID=2093833 RepID=UPI000CFA7E13|nr:hypothetical protein [Neorhizobium sp. T6_25]
MTFFDPSSNGVTLISRDQCHKLLFCQLETDDSLLLIGFRGGMATFKHTGGARTDSLKAIPPVSR